MKIPRTRIVKELLPDGSSIFNVEYETDGDWGYIKYTDIGVNSPVARAADDNIFNTHPDEYDHYGLISDERSIPIAFTSQYGAERWIKDVSYKVRDQRIMDERTIVGTYNEYGEKISNE